MTILASQRLLSARPCTGHCELDSKMRLDEDLVIRRDRPTMISAKYRAREERRRFLKISAGKLRRIEDPEASLCRSVLINNAVRRLQRENRDEKSRSNYALSVNYLHDSTKENNDNANIIGIADDDATSRKRLNEDSNPNEMDAKRQRHDDIELHDVFSDIYILPPTPRLLSHMEDVAPEPVSTTLYHHTERRFTDYTQDVDQLVISTTNESLYSIEEANARTAIDLALLKAHDHIDLVEDTAVLADRLFGDDTERLLYGTVEDRISSAVEDFSNRLAESSNGKVDLYNSLEEHHRLERSRMDLGNSQSCGRPFHDIQTFHSLVPGLES